MVYISYIDLKFLLGCYKLFYSCTLQSFQFIQIYTHPPQAHYKTKKNKSQLPAILPSEHFRYQILLQLQNRPMFFPIIPPF